MAVILRQKERKGKRKDNSISISVFRREQREWHDSRGRNTRFFGSTIVESRLGGLMALNQRTLMSFPAGVQIVRDPFSPGGGRDGRGF